MPMTAHDLLEAANLLSQADREWLALELLHPPGDGSTEAEVEAAWGVEIKRRLDDIDSGKAELVPLEEVLARMDARLAAKSRA
jgi:hypothetical protein